MLQPMQARDLVMKRLPQLESQSGGPWQAALCMELVTSARPWVRRQRRRWQCKIDPTAPSRVRGAGHRRPKHQLVIRELQSWQPHNPKLYTLRAEIGETLTLRILGHGSRTDSVPMVRVGGAERRAAARKQQQQQPRGGEGTAARNGSAAPAPPQHCSYRRLGLCLRRRQQRRCKEGRRRQRGRRLGGGGGRRSRR